MVEPTRSVNEELLRTLAGTFARLGTVDSTRLFPSGKAETLVVELRPEFYPDAVDEPRLEIRAYTDGSFHISYVERYLGDRRRCRWDRHDQPHNSRDHYHPFPDAGTDDAADRSYPDDIDAVLRDVVLPWVDEHIGSVWEA